MNTLFGISMDTIMAVTLGLFAVITAAVAVLALRNRLLLALALRGIPRRRAQTILIVVGLMLGTTIITAAFGTGDTMSYSLRGTTAHDLGAIDEIVTAKGATAYAAVAMPASTADRMRAALSPTIADGVSGAIAQPLALQDLTTRQTKAHVALLGVPTAYPAAFGPLTTVSGAAATLGQLGTDDIYLNAAAQQALAAHAGDQLRLFIAGQYVPVTVRAVLRDENLAAGGLLSGGASADPEVLLPVARAQALLGQPGQITDVLISNRGDALAGAALTSKVTSVLKSLPAGYRVQAVKKDGLDQADQAGSSFLSIFLVFGLFSIAVGLLLIFLIFVMLAAERRAEMGMARAVGTKRRHLIEQFIFEGYAYDLGAAIVGIVLGIGVGLGMTAIVAGLVGSAGLSIQPYIAPRSVVVAFSLGAIVTFATVAFSAWRVSRLNIVAAIRDLPDDLHADAGIAAAFRRPWADLCRAGRRLRGGHPLGALNATLAAPWHLVTAFRVFISRGPLLLLVGYALMRMGISGKQAFPFDLGISLLLVGSAMLLRWLLTGLHAPERIRNRIGYSLAGLSLVVFWLLPSDAIRADLHAGMEMFFLAGLMLVLGGVWTVMYNSDLLLGALLLTLGHVGALAPVLKTAVIYPLQHRFRTGLTLSMFSLVIFTLMAMSVLTGTYVGVSLNLDRDSGGYQVYGSVSPLNPIHFLIHGISYSGTSFAPSHIQMRDTRTGAVIPLTVIGVLDQSSLLGAGVYTAQSTLAAVRDAPAKPTTYYFRVAPGHDVHAMALALGSAFLTNGLDVTEVQAQYAKQTAISAGITTLLQAFMALGLIVGIAALGVVATRSVVERRQQIGMLRAIGYRRRMVQASFLLESSFVSLTGTALGVVLGLLLSGQIVNSMTKTDPSMHLIIPWARIAGIVALAYLASLLTAYLPAQQAARVAPAEALRYE